MPKQMDITGWREELRELYKSDFYQERWMADEVEDYPIPASKLFELMEILTTHKEFTDCYRAINDWYKKYPDRKYPRDDDPDNPTFPHEAAEPLSRFELWFCLKNSIGPNGWVIAFASQICLGFDRGRYSSIRSDEALAVLKEIGDDNTAIDWGK